MKINKLGSLVVSAILLTVCIIVGLNNPYLIDKEYEVVVLDKYSGVGGGKYSRMEFIIVYQTDNGKGFDRSVSPTVFAQSKVGDRVIVEAREMDIEQTTEKNIIFFFGQILLFSFSTMIGGVSILINCSPKFCKWLEEE